MNVRLAPMVGGLVLAASVVAGSGSGSGYGNPMSPSPAPSPAPGVSGSPGRARSPGTASLARLLSPSMHKYGDVFVPSGLSPERAQPATCCESRSWPYLRVEGLSRA